MSDLRAYSKSITSALGLIVVVLTALGDNAPAWVPTVLAVLTAVSVYLVPNRQATTAEIQAADAREDRGEPPL